VVELKLRGRTYRTLRRKHRLVADERPCVPGTYRGIFKAALATAPAAT
jgi:hypothetical protein